MKIPTTEEKLDIVRRYFAGSSMRALSRETGYSFRRIRSWVAKYKAKGEKGLQPPSKLRYAVLAVLMAVFVGATGMAAVEIVGNRSDKKAGESAYASLAQAVTKEENGKTQVDFAALQAINPQAIGWICSDDGSIHYPVMQGTDNEYYLTHLPDGAANESGSVFMDFRNSPELADKVSIIYGHNRKSGGMFSALTRYAEEGYAGEHPTLSLFTPEKTYTLQVAAGCVEPGNSDLYQIEFQNDEEFASYAEKIHALSQFDAGVKISAGDRLVILSTWTKEFDGNRYLLICRVV